MLFFPLMWLSIFIVFMAISISKISIPTFFSLLLSSDLHLLRFRTSFSISFLSRALPCYPLISLPFSLALISNFISPLATPVSRSLSFRFPDILTPLVTNLSISSPLPTVNHLFSEFYFFLFRNLHFHVSGIFTPRILLFLYYSPLLL